MLCPGLHFTEYVADALPFVFILLDTFRDVLIGPHEFPGTETSQRLLTHSLWAYRSSG